MVGGLWWAKRQLRQRGAVVVLTFHRVLSNSDFELTTSLPGIIVRQSTFDRLAKHISTEYEVVDLKTAAQRIASNRLRVAFTFDDGWDDNYSIVLPIAKAYGIPFTVFLCPGLIGCNAPFWPERIIRILAASGCSAQDPNVEATIERLKLYPPEEREHLIEKIASGNGSGGSQIEPVRGEMLSWKQIAEMDRAGVKFGSHTYTHQILTVAPSTVILSEIRESKGAIERNIWKLCELFAYPNGNWTADTIRVLAREGFKLAFTTERGAWMATSAPFAIPRVNMCEGSLAGIQSQFSRAMFDYTAFWKVWRAIKRTPRAAADRRPAPVAVPTHEGEAR
jgi:peptidoglycan/xylan/chitin deacetylase (PgdA/CDA1 family)